jgi:hypothetical protein
MANREFGRAAEVRDFCLIGESAPQAIVGCFFFLCSTVFFFPGFQEHTSTWRLSLALSARILPAG